MALKPNCDADMLPGWIYGILFVILLASIASLSLIVYVARS